MLQALQANFHPLRLDHISELSWAAQTVKAAIPAGSAVAVAPGTADKPALLSDAGNRFNEGSTKFGPGDQTGRDQTVGGRQARAIRQGPTG